MWHETATNMGWAVLFCVLGGAVGMFMVAMAAVLLPRIIERFTPNIDEEKEIARGNQAVAEYFGRVVSAAIIGASVVVAAAVLGGILAALH
jgi:ABC-type multidrug transport system fused ATPase/permease subunit